MAAATVVGFSAAAPLGVASAEGTATLTSFTMPAAVDTTAGAQLITLTAHVTATEAVSGGFVTLGLPDTGASTSGWFDLVDPEAVSSDADWRAYVEVPQYTRSGSWVVQSLQFWDVWGAHVLLSHDAGTLEAAGLPYAVAVTAATDASAPVVQDVLIQPSAVDVSSASADVTLRVTAADEGAGTSWGYLVLRGPDGQLLEGNVGAVEGTTDLVGTVTVPMWSDVGTWLVKELVLSDRADNKATWSTADLAELGITPTLAVSGPVDTTAPELTGLSFSPATVDVSSSSQQVTVSWAATDAGSGFVSGFLRLTGPSGGQPLETGLWLEPGAEMTSTLTVPQYATAGTWSVSYLQVADARNNLREYDASTLPGGAGITSSITVVNSTADTTAPVLAGVTFEPSTVDVSGGPVDVTMTLTVTDDLSGWSYGGYEVLMPSGAGFTGDELMPGDGPTTSGTYTTTFTVPANAEAGTWGLGEVVLRDAVGNQRTYPPTTLPTGSTFVVTGVTATAPDAPELGDATPGDRQVALQWWRPRNTGGSPVTGYDVEVAVGSTSTFREVAPAGSELTYVVDELVNGTAYRFRVRAVNAVGAGPWSDWTALLRPSAVPGAVVGLTGSGMTAEAVVDWEPPVSDGGTPLLAYEVRVSPVVGTPWTLTVPVGQTYADITVTPDLSYAFEVRALNAAGPGAWSRVTVDDTALEVSSLRAGGKVSVKLWSMGAPLAGTSVRLVGITDPTFALSAVTSSKGIASVRLPSTGKVRHQYHWVFGGGAGYFGSSSAVIG